MLFNNIQGINSLRQIASKLQLAFKNIQQLCTSYITTLQQNQNQGQKYHLAIKSNNIIPLNKTSAVKNGEYNYENIQTRYAQNEMKAPQIYKKNVQSTYNDSQKNKYLLQNNLQKILTKRLQPSIAKKAQQNNFREAINQKKQVVQPPNIVPQPLKPFYLFLKEKKATITKQYPQLSPQQMAQVMKQIWNGLTSQQKQPYQRMYELNNSVYNKNSKQIQEIYKKSSKGKT